MVHEEHGAVGGGAMRVLAAPCRNERRNNNDDAWQHLLGHGVMIMPPPQPFQIPTDPRYVNPHTGRVQLHVSRERRNKRFIRNERLICHAEGIDGFFQTAPLFVAERHGRGFRIFDVSGDSPNQLAALPTAPHYFGMESKDDPRFAGEIHRSVSHLGGYVEYKLVRENLKTKERQLVATTIMGTSSLRYPIVHGYADRIVYCVVDSENAMDKEVSSKSTDKIPHFGSLNKPVIEHIRDNIHKIGEEHKELKVFQSKRRFTNWRGCNVHRDVQPFFQKFHGRAQRPSKKNLQIMDVSSGKVVVQVGRLNDNDFALDFLPPYTPLQVLGVFLAQLDAN
jgi:hypothetical protein